MSWPDGASGPVDPYQGQPAAPVPPWNPYANPGSWEPAQYLPRQSPPGTIIAASVVGYLLALFLFITGLFLLFFASVVGLFADVDGASRTGASLAIAGAGNWIAVGLFVSGGVLVTLRRPAGLILVLVGSALVVVLAVYWMTIHAGDGFLFWAIVHIVLALVPAGLAALPPGNRAWLAGQPGSAPPPRPAGPPPFPTDRYGRPFGS